MIRKLFLATTLPLALAACGGASVDAGETGENADARGEVLGGTISDSMIPLDELKSHSPPLKASPVARSTSGGAESASGAEEAEEPAAEESPAAEDTTPELPEG
ncbi:MAG: hypothetical protein R3E14_03905 [Erythrobacter sp.]